MSNVIEFPNGSNDNDNDTGSDEPEHHNFRIVLNDKTEFNVEGYLFSTPTFAAVGRGGQFVALVPMGNLSFIARVDPRPALNG